MASTKASRLQPARRAPKRRRCSLIEVYDSPGDASDTSAVKVTADHCRNRRPVCRNRPVGAHPDIDILKLVGRFALRSSCVSASGLVNQRTASLDHGLQDQVGELRAGHELPPVLTNGRSPARKSSSSLAYFALSV